MGRDTQARTVGLLTIEREPSVMLRERGAGRLRITRRLASPRMTAFIAMVWYLPALIGVPAIFGMALTGPSASMPFLLGIAAVFAITMPLHAWWFWHSHPRWHVVECVEDRITVKRGVPGIRPRELSATSIAGFEAVPTEGSWFAVCTVAADGTQQRLTNAKEDAARTAVEALRSWHEATRSPGP